MMLVYFYQWTTGKYALSVSYGAFNVEVIASHPPQRTAHNTQRQLIRDVL